MRSARFFAIGFSFLVGSLLSAATEPTNMNNFCFQRDKMIVSDDNGVYAVSSVFQSQDQLIAYSSLSGRELWSFRFSFRKIVSLSIGSKGVFVLSKSNSMNRCYVTCLDLATGREIWENNFRDL